WEDLQCILDKGVDTCLAALPPIYGEGGKPSENPCKTIWSALVSSGCLKPHPPNGEGFQFANTGSLFNWVQDPGGLGFNGGIDKAGALLQICSGLCRSDECQNDHADPTRLPLPGKIRNGQCLVPYSPNSLGIKDHSLQFPDGQEIRASA